MPLLFSLAIEVKREMRAWEELFAFLDDVYILSSPARTRFLYNLVGEKLLSMSGIQLHTGKTRCCDRIGQPPPDMEALGREVWSPGGIKVLGTLGSAEFEQEASNQRLQEERMLWEAIPWIPDLQCAWQVLLQCSGPRCHHSLRTMPPCSSASYAEGHDEGMS